jgi:hypothetical protein
MNSLIEIRITVHPQANVKESANRRHFKVRQEASTGPVNIQQFSYNNMFLQDLYLNPHKTALPSAGWNNKQS